MKNDGENRIVFLDALRILAIFLVMMVHCCECYYFAADGSFRIENATDAWWLTVIDSASRASVPLFVMASAYLLFPIKGTTGGFLWRRLKRVGIPFAIWACLYNWRYAGSWGQMLFNFPATTGGHLWFVPMLLGIYLLMPLLSPWAERASEREVRGWLIVWLFTLTFPFLRYGWGCLYGAPSYGAVPFLYGECAWNSFGTFHYVSGFFGYMLLGFWFRKFAPSLSWCKTLLIALPLLAVGWLTIWAPAYFSLRNGYPAIGPYSRAVDFEMSWMFCSVGVAIMTMGYFMLLRKCEARGAFYRWVVRPLSEASFGVYLLHMFVLVEVMAWLKPSLPTGMAIVAGAAIVYLSSSAMSMAIRKLPFIGKYICG